MNYVGQWTLLIDKNMSKTELKDAAKVSSNVIAKIGKNESVSIEELVKICLNLRVDIAT
jgi:putative transcriptional regulator